MGIKIIGRHQKPGRPNTDAVIRYKLRSGRERVQIKRWWNEGGNHKNYIDCSAAELKTQDGCTYILVWPHSFDSRLDVVWSVRYGTLSFSKFKRCTRVALLCSDGVTVLSHWKFGTRPGQKPKEVVVSDYCPDGCIPGGGGGGGGGCSTDDDCPDGYICEDGICVPDPTPPDTDRCWTIPELPTIDSSEPVAPKSTELLGVCIDIPNLPDLQ